MPTFARPYLVALIAMPAITSCVSSGRQVELAGVARPRQGVRSSAPGTVDLLPIESQVVVAHAGHPLADGDAAMALRAGVTSALPPALAARRYRLASVIDRTGRFSRGGVRQAMTAPELSATRGAFVRHSQAQLDSPRRLLSPALPHRLGASTGSRATLFVAGCGIAGDDATHFEDVLMALALTQATFATVGAVGAVASNDDGVEGVADAVGDYADHMAEANALMDEAAARAELRPPRSHLRLVVTLVDNATGAVLWHSDRVFRGVDPTDPAKVRRAVEKSLRRLPRPATR